MNRLNPADAELAVLGGILLRNDLIATVDLDPGDFYNPIHRAVWDAYGRLSAKQVPIDEVTLRDALITSGEYDAVGGDAFIYQLSLRCPTVDNTAHYADTVRESAHLRRMLLLSGSVESRITGGITPIELQELFRKEAPPLVRGTTVPTMADVRPAAVPGLPTGLGIERYVPGGLPRDKVTVIYGESGNFKTTVKNHLLFSLAMEGKRVLDVSLEDSSDLTYARYLARRYKLPYGELAAQLIEPPKLDDEDRRVLGNIVDGSHVAPNISDITRMARAQDVVAVFIDYIQLMEGCSGDHVAIAEIMRQAQLAAKEDGIAYVFVSQVKQDVKYRATARDNRGRPIGSPRPDISDCFGSASIRTHAKLGIGVFRPFNYNPAPTNPDDPYYGPYCEWLNNQLDQGKASMQYYGVLELIIGKNVLGPCNKTVHCFVDAPTGTLVPTKTFEPWSL